MVLRMLSPGSVVVKGGIEMFKLATGISGSIDS
jgi:hypothetical protein